MAERETALLRYGPVRTYDEVYRLEAEGYPSDEAASLEALRYRGSVAPELFLCAYVPATKIQETAETKDELVGYVVSTLAEGDKLTHASMSHHVPTGRLVCIHSVCVESHHRRRGIASQILNEYVSRLRQRNNDAAVGELLPYSAVSLLCHRHLLSLYVDRCGFRLVGESDVVHGKEKWYECRMDLTRRE